MSPPPASVAACVPVFGGEKYLRDSVLSLVRQTHEDMRIILIDDGSPKSPWSVIADIDDPRIVTYDLDTNRGPYFCRAVAMAATDEPYLLVHDSDDRCDETQVTKLLSALMENRADYAFATQARFVEAESGDVSFLKFDFPEGTEEPFDERLLYRLPHHGLFRRTSLEAVGGFYGGFNFGYDLLLANLMFLRGAIAWVPEPLYIRLCHPGSLTTSAQTGLRTPARLAVDAALAATFREAFALHAAWQNGAMTRAAFQEALRALAVAQLPDADARAIAAHGKRLREKIAAEMQRKFPAT